MNEHTNMTGKSRNVFETAISPLLMLGPLVAICQFAQQPVNIPSAELKRASCVACDDSAKNTLKSEGVHKPPRGHRHPNING
jgi:hypothetical protein